MRICFDLDGTLANTYGVPNWLEMLRNEDPTPYEVAKPLVRLSTLAYYLNKCQKMGHELVVISWLSKSGSSEYAEAVTEAKKNWLTAHMPSVVWDELHIVPYGTPKQKYCRSRSCVLFDDESPNREAWNGIAYPETAIFEVLKELTKDGMYC